MVMMKSTPGKMSYMGDFDNKESTTRSSSNDIVDCTVTVSPYFYYLTPEDCGLTPQYKTAVKIDPWTR